MPQEHSSESRTRKNRVGVEREQGASSNEWDVPSYIMAQARIDELARRILERSGETIRLSLTARCHSIPDFISNHLIAQITPPTMDLLQTVRKEGSRGGRDEFKWEDVKTSGHRENYLGHSLMARKYQLQRAIKASF